MDREMYGDNTLAFINQLSGTLRLLRLSVAAFNIAQLFMSPTGEQDAHPCPPQIAISNEQA
jgi:hypothetical protein